MQHCIIHTFKYWLQIGRYQFVSIMGDIGMLWCTHTFVQPSSLRSDNLLNQACSSITHYKTARLLFRYMHRKACPGFNDAFCFEPVQVGFGFSLLLLLGLIELQSALLLL